MIVVVSGARALLESRGGSAGSERWARAVLVRLLLEAPHDAIVVHGGAIGPDTWADEEAAAIGLRRIVYLPSGLRRASYEPERRWAAGPESPGPLPRNSAMVRAAASQARRHGRPVRVVGLLAPWSPTRGTEHCLGCAAREGLAPERFTAPAHLSGAGARERAEALHQAARERTDPVRALAREAIEMGRQAARERADRERELELAVLRRRFAAGAAALPSAAERASLTESALRLLREAREATEARAAGAALDAAERAQG